VVTSILSSCPHPIEGQGARPVCLAYLLALKVVVGRSCAKEVGLHLGE
jgi:hypothetical protein